MHNGDHRRREEREGTKGILEEIMAENFPDVMKNIHLHSQDAP